MKIQNTQNPKIPTCSSLVVYFSITVFANNSVLLLFFHDFLPTFDFFYYFCNKYRQIVVNDACYGLIPWVQGGGMIFEG